MRQDNKGLEHTTQNCSIISSSCNFDTNEKSNLYSFDDLEEL